MRVSLYFTLFYDILSPTFKWKQGVGFILFCILSYTGIAQPKIHAIAPLSGPTGTTVTITGANFNPILEHNTVYFGAVKARILFANTTSLVVTVPVGATYEPITVTTNGFTAASSQPFTVTFACGGALNASTFNSAVNIQGDGIYNIRNADIDGDGKTDLIYQTNTSIVVSKNTSTINDIKFEPGIKIAASCGYKFDIGDVDGDGKLDLMTPNACNETVSIIKNNSTPGIISFAAKIDYKVGEFPYAVALGNLDEDGRPDLVVVNMWGRSLSVLQNLTVGGTISFGNKTDYVLGRDCRDIVITDLDGDGKNDMAVPSQINDHVSLFRNMGTAGTILFAAREDISTGTSDPEDLVVTDLDGDGKPDVAVTNNNTPGTISIFRNQSIPGSFSFPSKKDFNTGPYPYRMVCADFNGDGKPDLAIKDQYSSVLTLLENICSPGVIAFAPKVDFPTSSTQREHITAGDFNNDGKPDIAVSNYYTILTFTNSSIPLSVTTINTIPGCAVNDGSVTVKELGGVAPFQFKLGTLPFQSSGTFNNLASGTHDVRVKDATGCTATLEVTLTRNSLAFNLTVTKASCNSDNGSLLINASGSNPPFTYSLDAENYHTNPRFENLSPGIYNAYVKDKGGCISQQGFAVESSCVTISTVLKNTTCGYSNGNIKVQASGGTAPYHFSLDNRVYALNNEFGNLTAGDYTIYVKDASGTTSTSTVTLLNSAGPEITSVTPTPADCNNNTGALTLTSQYGTPPFRYSLNAGTFQSDPTFSFLSSESYKVTVQDANGCFDSRTVFVPVNNTLTINAGNDTTVCEGQELRLNATTNGQHHLWKPVSTLSNSLVLKPMAKPTFTTHYILTTTLGACTASDTVVVSVTPAPIADAGKDAVICVGQQVTLQGAGGIEYMWSTAVGLSNHSLPNPVVTPPSRGSYVYALHVKDSKGCKSVQPGYVKVKVVSPVVDAGNDTAILANQPFQLQAKDPNNQGFTRYSWSPATGINNPNIANPVMNTDRETIYTLTAETPNGCLATDTIVVKVYTGIDIYVPNAFTPNNDGRNDILKPFTVGIKEFKHFSIYNRWGQLVFQSNNASKGWNGKLNGILQSGVFVWIAEGLDFNGNLIRRKGTTALVM